MIDRNVGLTVLSVSAPLAAFIILSGCSAAVVTGQLVGGSMASDHRVTIDDSTVSPEFKVGLKKARKLAFMAEPKTETFYLAEYLENQGAFATELEALPKLASPSQRRKAMKALCKPKDGPDFVFAPASSETEAGGAGVAKVIFTGRAEANIKGVVDALRCPDGSVNQFAIKFELNQGVYASDRPQMARIVGYEIGKAFLVMAGKESLSTAK